MPNETIQLSATSYITVEECPRDYYGDAKKRAERVVLYSDNKKVLTWDVYLSEDTRYTLVMDVEPEFRDGKFLDVLANADPGSLSRFDRQYVVWLNAGEPVVHREAAFVDGLKVFNEREILKTGTVLIHGAANKVVPISE